MSAKSCNSRPLKVVTVDFYRVEILLLQLFPCNSYNFALPVFAASGAKKGTVTVLQLFKLVSIALLFVYGSLLNGKVVTVDRILNY